MLRNFLIGGLVAGVIGASAASAATVNVTTINNPVYTTPQVFDFTTTGANMGGMVVTANFANGSSESVAWSATGLESGGVFGSLFSLVVDGDTYTSIWSLVNSAASALTSVFLNGPAGHTIFDRTEPSTGPDFGTENSRRGRDFAYVSGAPEGEIDVTYSGIIQVEGSAGPVGDIYAFLNIDLSGLTGANDGGLASGGALRFRQDTDNAVVPVPVPASILLFASALGGVGFLMRRKATV